MKKLLLPALISIIIFSSAYAIYAADCFRQRTFSSSTIQYTPQYAEVYYFVGQPLRIKALVELEEAEEYAEFLRYKATYRQKGAFPETVPSEDKVSTDNSARESLITQICSKCHSGSAPKAQLTFTLDSFLDLDTFKKARNAVLSGEMPKGKKLTEMEKAQVVSELSTLLGD